MSRLYIANPTKQTQVVCYRVDIDEAGERKDTNRRFQPARQQEIRPGQQIQLGSDFHIKQIEDIVDQLSTFGLIGVVDVPRLRAADLSNMRRNVVPYIFNIDRAVPAEAIRKVIAHNSSILIDDGRQRRAKSAVASSEMVQHAVAQQFAENGIDDKPADQIAVSFEQEEQSEAGEKTIAEGYHVVPNRGAATGGRKVGKGRSRRGA